MAKRRPLSEGTKSLLSEMMSSSRLSHRQRQELMKKASTQTTLPQPGITTKRQLRRPARVKRKKVAPSSEPKGYGKKPLQKILKDERGYKVEQAPREPIRDRELEKERFLRKRTAEEDTIPKGGVVTIQRTVQVSPPRDESEIDHITREIDERIEFLEAMDDLGKKNEYEPVIRAQLGEYERQLEGMGSK